MSQAIEVTNPVQVRNPSVVVSNVDKDYVIHPSYSKGSKGSNVVSALRDVSFVARRGESIGFIGRNGSGKSTLIRLIGGEESPTRGYIQVGGVPSMLGVTPALQQYLSGAQNIFLGLLALGMDKEYARAQVPEIAKWAGLEQAIDRPMKTYSSGMKAKLGFAIATSREPDILLVDEALSTGDAAFAEKARQRMSDLLGRAGNLFFVSHSVKQIVANCPRVIWLHDGQVVADGDSESISADYLQFSKLLTSSRQEDAEAFLTEYRATYVKPEIREI
ncbi:ABC transporter ATP-binding protein [Corynebacterium resistens]